MSKKTGLSGEDCKEGAHDIAAAMTMERLAGKVFKYPATVAYYKILDYFFRPYKKRRDQVIISDDIVRGAIADQAAEKEREPDALDVIRSGQDGDKVLIFLYVNRKKKIKSVLSRLAEIMTDDYVIKNARALIKVKRALSGRL